VTSAECKSAEWFVETCCSHSADPLSGLLVGAGILVSQVVSRCLEVCCSWTAAFVPLCVLLNQERDCVSHTVCMCVNRGVVPPVGLVSQVADDA